jgi:hypothetical protein
MEKRAPSVYRLRINDADSEIRQGLKFAGAGCEASLCNVAATSWGSEGAEIGAVALWGRAPSVYRNLKSAHGKAALTINGGGTGDGGRSDLFSVNESGEASTGGGLVFGALSRAAVLNTAPGANPPEIRNTTNPSRRTVLAGVSVAIAPMAAAVNKSPAAADSPEPIFAAMSRRTFTGSRWGRSEQRGSSDSLSIGNGEITHEQNHRCQRTRIERT